MKRYLYLTILQLLVFNHSAGKGIEGQVVNESRGGAPVKNVELILHQVDGDFVEKIRTDHEGRFKLEGIEGDPEDFYHLLTRYEGVDYFTEQFRLVEPKEIQISVYDSTHSDEAIEAEAHHLIVEVDKRELTVTEIIILHNSGEKTFVGEIEIPLPKGAMNPEFLEGIRGVEIDGRFYDDQGIKPGSKEMVFRYRINASSQKAILSSHLHFPTSLLSFLISDPHLSVKSSQLSNSEVQRIGDREYLSLVGRDLPKGSVVEVVVEGLPRGWRFSGIFLVGGLFLLVVVGVGLQVMKRVWDRAPKEELLERRGFFVSTLADLEERFEKGKISKEFYEEIRTIHRKRLKKVLETLEVKRERE